MKKLLRGSLLALFFLPLLAHAQKGPIKVADEHELDLSTEHPYNPEGKDGLVFEKKFSSKNSSYIKFYFENFQLEGDDHVEILSPETGQSFIYAGGGKVLEGGGRTISDFWSLMVRDDEAIVRLYSNGPASTYGFDLSKVAYGYPEDSIETLVYESVCGSDDKEDVECYSSTTMYDKAEAVCKLYIDGSGLCTGWLLGDQGHVMTNNHCINNSTDANNTEFQFDYRHQTCGGSNASADVVANSSTLICTDPDLDYTLLELPNNPTSTYGFLQFRASGPVDGERIYIPQHPNGVPKKISVNDDQSSTGYGKIQNANGTNQAGLPTKVEYFTDTDGGSSGSPVIGYSDHNVVALHNTGNCTSGNGGNRVDSIMSDMGSCFPASGVDSVVIADFTADKVKSCNGSVAFTDGSSNADSLLWDFDDGDTSHATDPSHTYSASGTYTVQLVAYGAQGGNDTSMRDVHVALVDTPNTTGDTICAGASATLSASGSGGDILWYDDSSTAPIDTGTSFTTGSIASDSSFFVRQNEGGISTQNLGPIDSSLGSGEYFTSNDNWGCVFDVHKPIVLESTKVYSDYAALRTIELIHDGSVVASKDIFIGNGQERIDLNFEIPPGRGYLLKVTGSTVNLYRNDGGASYPYEIPGLVSITGNNTPSNYNAGDFYYYFYDWEVHEQRCKSPWKTVDVVTADSNLIDTLEVNDVQTCDGSDGSVSVMASSGTTPYQYSLDGGGFQSNNSFTGLGGGSYDLIVEDAGGCRDTATADVDPLPSPVIDNIDTSSITACGAGDGVIDVTASGGTGSLVYKLGFMATYQVSNSFTGLVEGAYQVKVRDDSGCTAVDSAELVVEHRPTIDSISSSMVSCYGNSDGGLVIHSSNADSTSINDGLDYQASDSFGGLASGTYQVKVKSVAGCKDSIQATVDEPDSISLSAGSQPSSGSDCDGTAWVNVSGGTPNYDHQWDVQGSVNNDTLDSLCAGTYQVVVTDSNGCQDSIEVGVDKETSISELDAAGDWALHPVPASDRITIVRPENARGQEFTVTFYNMLGESVFQRELDPALKEQVLDLSGISEGVYMVDLKGRSGREQFKVPVTRGGH